MPLAAWAPVARLGGGDFFEYMHQATLPSPPRPKRRLTRRSKRPRPQNTPSCCATRASPVVGRACLNRRKHAQPQRSAAYPSVLTAAPSNFAGNIRAVKLPRPNQPYQWGLHREPAHAKPRRSPLSVSVHGNTNIRIGHARMCMALRSMELCPGLSVLCNDKLDIPRNRIRQSSKWTLAPSMRKKVPGGRPDLSRGSASPCEGPTSVKLQSEATRFICSPRTTSRRV